MITSVPRTSATAASVQPLFGLDNPSAGPFPSNRFTQPDDSQLTGLRVNLPKPDCSLRPSDCADIDVINTLDGFNLQPRVSIPFSDPIDLATVDSSTVFIVSLGDSGNGAGAGTTVGINQVVWDPVTNTLHAEADALLDQHTRYALIVTRDLRDLSGRPIEVSETFDRFRHDLNFGQAKDPDLKAYREMLLDALARTALAGVPPADVVVASVFTTQSATATLEKIRNQIKAGNPDLADFKLGPSGARTSFALRDVTRIIWSQQIGEDPSRFNDVRVPIELLEIVPGTVGEIAFGKYLSPDYEWHPGEFIPPIGTRTGIPVVQRTNEIYFNLFLPSGPAPAGGWPVAITGHGSTQTKNLYAFNVASAMAERGLATIAINAVGHGFGPLGTLNVTLNTGASVTFSSGGRGIDQNGDGAVGAMEGIEAARPRTILHDRDGLRQTVVDLMQLVRVIEIGMDVDGDGTPDLDPSRINYFGFSLGGAYGAQFLAVEPNLAAGVLNVPVALQAVRGALSPVFRPSRGAWLAERTPSLINSPGLTAIGGIPVGPPFFDENLPLRNRPPVINDVEGAMAIQEFFENAEWAAMSGDAMAYVPHLRRAPLAGVPSHPILLQFDAGDQNVPNPITSMILRAGELADIATYYRHDLAFAENPALPKNGHGFMQATPNLAFRQISISAERQIATFFASGGTEIVHPEPQRFFEVPIVLPLPEDLNYIH